jgi:hypothetical protein
MKKEWAFRYHSTRQKNGERVRKTAKKEPRSPPTLPLLSCGKQLAGRV